MYLIILFDYSKNVWNSIGWTGAGVIFAILIGLINFYFNFLRGQKYKLFFGHIKIARLFTSGKEYPDDYVSMLLFKIVNIGHQAGVIEDIKVILTRGNEYIKSFPVGKLPRGAIEGDISFKEYGLLVGSPTFYPFILQPKEIWESFFRFSDGNQLFDFMAKGESLLEIFIYTQGNWKCIFKDELSDGIVESYYGGQKMIPAAGGAIQNYIYTKNRDLRRSTK